MLNDIINCGKEEKITKSSGELGKIEKESYDCLSGPVARKMP